MPFGHSDVCLYSLRHRGCETRPHSSFFRFGPTLLPETYESTTHEQRGEALMKTWINALCAELNLPADINVDAILDVAHVAAHNVERPAAPVTTFLLGVVVAGGMDMNEAAAKIQGLAATWPTSPA
jgi:hypothetical protein